MQLQLHPLPAHQPDPIPIHFRIKSGPLLAGCCRLGSNPTPRPTPPSNKPTPSPFAFLSSLDPEKCYDSFRNTSFTGDHSKGNSRLISRPTHVTPVPSPPLSLSFPSLFSRSSPDPPPGRAARRRAPISGEQRGREVRRRPRAPLRRWELRPQRAFFSLDPASAGAGGAGKRHSGEAPRAGDAGGGEDAPPPPVYFFSFFHTIFF